MVTVLERNYDRQIVAVNKQVLSFAQRSWATLGTYRDADAALLKAKLIPRVEAGQKRVAELTDAFIARSAAVQGESMRRGSVAPASTLALRGVPADEVYQRPFTSTYTTLSEGGSFTAAKTAGAVRLASIVNTGMQLAKTHSARTALMRSGFETFARTLTGRENCALCVIASTQRYWKGELLPIHPGCDCGVEGRRGDPNEQVIDPDMLDRMHSAVEQEFGASERGARVIDGLGEYNDYMDLIVTNVHGEIGPVLSWRDQHFTALADLAN